MTLPLLYVGGGVLLLWFGAEWLVRGASALAVRLQVAPVLVGLTVVSLGTSAPELVVSVLAAVRGSADLAVGGILGSNMANVGLILGVAALIRPLQVAEPLVRRDIPWMLAVTVLVFPMMLDLRVGRVDAVLLGVVLAAYLFFLLRAAGWGRSAPRKVPAPAQAPGAARPAGLALPVLGLVAGALALVAGGHGVVVGATEVAALLEVPELIVGLSVVAVGTSLPELATVIIAAVRREADLAVGNIVGSNLFNLTFVLGGTALVSPLPVQPRVLPGEFPAMLALSLVLVPLALTQRRIGRAEGLFVLALYAAAWAWIMVGPA